MTENQIREKMVQNAEKYIGISEGTTAHKKLVDKYNAHTPLARGYKLKTSDPWCAGTVSVFAIDMGHTDIIPTEVSCTRMIEGFKALGTFVESDFYVPKAADVIFYDWDDSGSGDNTGSSDHVGLVQKVVGNTIYVIEGNYSNAVKVRTIAVNGRYIRGFGVPNYAKKATSKTPTTTTSTAKKSVDEIAKEVIAGKWGNGDARKSALAAAGYDYSDVQAKVNALVSGKKSVDEIAREVIQGKWGNGADRKNRLTAAGYDYAAVQARVNQLV